ncbi:hypothetical protein AcW1_006963 [Taiwanofungus camphoratus]|nr:hypothetical protein AcW1_006963 [Antrodia cinnamomea]
MGMQKRVSFCEEEALEEVHEADEWDRSPAPVTPRLSYQDVLELKQLRLCLPRTAPCPTPRQPFTTSLPPALQTHPPATRRRSRTRASPHSRRTRPRAGRIVGQTRSGRSGHPAVPRRRPHPSPASA